jgi:hypothetical protein
VKTRQAYSFSFGRKQLEMEITKSCQNQSLINLCFIDKTIQFLASTIQKKSLVVNHDFYNSEENVKSSDTSIKTMNSMKKHCISLVNTETNKSRTTTY